MRKTLLGRLLIIKACGAVLVIGAAVMILLSGADFRLSSDWPIVACGAGGVIGVLIAWVSGRIIAGPPTE